MGLDYNVKEIRLYDGTTIPVVKMDDEWGRDFDFPDDDVRVLEIPADGTVLNFLLKFKLWGTVRKAVPSSKLYL